MDWPELRLVFTDQSHDYLMQNHKHKEKCNLAPAKWKPQKLRNMFKIEVALQKLDIENLNVEGGKAILQRPDMQLALPAK